MDINARPGPASPGAKRASVGLVRQFALLAGGYWRGESGRWAWPLALGLVLLNAAEVALLLALNAWNRDLFDALERRAEFQVLLGCGEVLLLLAGGFALTSFLNLHARRRLAVGWRGWLTGRLTTAWLQDEGEGKAGHANADGRIAEDARIATEEAVELACSMSQGLIRLACFVSLLWTLSAHPPFVLGGIYFGLPGYLLWVAMLYAGMGMMVAGLLGRPLVRSTEQRQTSEAEFRVALVTARDGENGNPQPRLERLFTRLAHAFGRQTVASARLQLFGVGNVRLGAGLPFLVATPAYLSGVVTLGWLMQAALAFQEVASALNWPVDNMPRIATWRASVQRVLALHHAGMAGPARPPGQPLPAALRARQAAGLEEQGRGSLPVVASGG